MIDFLLDNYKLIISGVFLVVSFIILLVKKRNITSVLDDIYNFAILAVNEIEAYSLVDPEIKGQVKLDMAIDLVIKWLSNLYPGINAKSFIGSIKNIIEKILTTPQKKG